MKKILLFLVVLGLVGTIVLWLRYGGGAPYPDLSTAPVLDAGSLEEVLSYDEPIGNVAVNRDGRIFFTVHPESRPRGNKLLEYVRGAAVPYPSGGEQSELFDTVLGIAIDRYNRLWTIDHGNHGWRSPRIIAFDLDTDVIIREQILPPEVAPAGSFLQDLQVSADGNTIIIADTSLWRKAPAIIVYDIETGSARRVLQSHSSVSAEDYMIRNNDREMEFLGGIVALRGGVDGIALGEEWLYYGALNGSGLFRIRLTDLKNASLPPGQLANRVERVGDKPLSDGMSIDLEGNVYITDIEHNAVFMASPGGIMATLIRSPEIRWPDALSFGPDGYLYLADSALGELILRPREHIDAQAPYRIFRFRPGAQGVAGQ
ncbi:MAG TPA: L-dopachrome tautomerase-related protein [Woeseiaceae bacterium]|nr:L-dopachrome tautomerase-related protein [Woeseiaceae bacterium]